MLERLRFLSTLRRLSRGSRGPRPSPLAPSDSYSSHAGPASSPSRADTPLAAALAGPRRARALRRLHLVHIYAPQAHAAIRATPSNELRDLVNWVKSTTGASYAEFVTAAAKLSPYERSEYTLRTADLEFKVNRTQLWLLAAPRTQRLQVIDDVAAEVRRLPPSERKEYVDAWCHTLVRVDDSHPLQSLFSVPRLSAEQPSTQQIRYALQASARIASALDDPRAHGHVCSALQVRAPGDWEAFLRDCEASIRGGIVEQVGHIDELSRARLGETSASFAARLTGAFDASRLPSLAGALTTTDDACNICLKDAHELDEPVIYLGVGGKQFLAERAELVRWVTTSNGKHPTDRNAKLDASNIFTVDKADLLKHLNKLR